MATRDGALPIMLSYIEIGVKLIFIRNIIINVYLGKIVITSNNCVYCTSEIIFISYCNINYLVQLVI